MPEENTENIKKKKQDFLAPKKVTSQNFSITKDIKPEKKHYAPGIFSWLISFILIIASIGSVFGYLVFFNNTNVLKEVKEYSVFSTYNFLNSNLTLENKNTLEKNVGKYNGTVTAKAIGIYELNSGKAIYEYNADQKLPFASITKLFTIETMRSVIPQGTNIRMDSLGYNIEGSKINIPAGETISYDDAIYAMMMASANDVALSVAKQYGYDNFVVKMNNFAQAIGLKNTSLTSPIGFDDPNNYSTAQDIFVISRMYLKDTMNKRAASTLQYTVKSNVSSYPIQNTNELLDQPQVFGLKTGTEDKAGQCLVLYIKIQDREYVAVILGSQDRWKEGQRIIDWLKTNG